jgi:hypothetical protein
VDSLLVELGSGSSPGNLSTFEVGHDGGAVDPVFAGKLFDWDALLVVSDEGVQFTRRQTMLDLQRSWFADR